MQWLPILEDCLFWVGNPLQICGSIGNSSLQRSFICIFLKREAAHFGWVIFPEKSAHRFLISPVTSHFEAPSRFSFPSKTFVIVSFWDCHEIMGVVVLIPIHLEKKQVLPWFPAIISSPLPEKTSDIFVLLLPIWNLRKSDWSLKSGQLVYIGNIPKWRLGRLSSFWINISRKFLVQHFNQCPNCGKSPHSARVQAEQRRLMHLEKGECPGSRILTDNQRKNWWLEVVSG